MMEVIVNTLKCPNNTPNNSILLNTNQSRLEIYFMAFDQFTCQKYLICTVQMMDVFTCAWVLGVDLAELGLHYLHLTIMITFLRFPEHLHFFLITFSLTIILFLSHSCKYLHSFLFYAALTGVQIWTHLLVCFDPLGQSSVLLPQQL